MTAVTATETPAAPQRRRSPVRRPLVVVLALVVVAAIILGLFTSISDFALYNVVDAVTSLISR